MSEETLPILELRDVLQCHGRPLSELPKVALGLRHRSERADELADFRLQVMHLASLARKHAHKVTVEDLCDALDAVRAGLPKPAIFQ